MPTCFVMWNALTTFLAIFRRAIILRCMQLIIITRRVAVDQFTWRFAHTYGPQNFIFRSWEFQGGMLLSYKLPFNHKTFSSSPKGAFHSICQNWLASSIILQTECTNLNGSSYATFLNYFKFAHTTQSENVSFWRIRRNSPLNLYTPFRDQPISPLISDN